MLSYRLLQFAGDDSWLDHGDTVSRIDFEDLIHPHHRDQDAVVNGHASAGVTASRCPCVDSNVVCRGILEHSGNVFRRLREDHNVWQAGCVPFIGGVLCEYIRSR